MGGTLIDYFLVDRRYEPYRVIDEYNTMSWTERYDDVGEFQLTYSEKEFLNSGVSIGMNISNSKSTTVMTVKSVSRKIEQDGRISYVVEGRSLQNILSYRAIFKGSSNPNLKLKGTLGKVVCDAVKSCFVEGRTFYPHDIVPGFYTVDRSNSNETLTVELKPEELLGVVKNLCSMGDLGFDIIPEDGGSRLGFKVYSGIERSQVISMDFGNLKGEQNYSSDMDYKNVAYVWSADQSRAIATSADGTTTSRFTGLARRVLNIKADDISADEYEDPNEFNNALVSRGRFELARNRKVDLLEAEVVDEKMKYLDDFKLGDILTFRGVDEKYKKVRVSENIWTHDQDGFRSYPTIRNLSNE